MKQAIQIERLQLHWIDTRLGEEEMNFFHNAISEENKENWNHGLAGNISKSELIKDKDNWFYEKVLKNLTERLFYRDCDNYYEEYIENKTPPPEFELGTLWVNYQKKHEFNPLHIHNGGRGYSFVVFMKIPTHWKEQHALPISVNSTKPCASDFCFVWTGKGNKIPETANFSLSSEDEGRMLFFPAWLSHQVYPFYECEEERITISGNITMKEEKKTKVSKVVTDDIVGKENILKMLEQGVMFQKDEVERMKRKEKRKREG